MSRAKFDEWYKIFRAIGKTDEQADYEIWLAGRESMRDEALKACGDIGPDAFKAFHAINDIQP